MTGFDQVFTNVAGIVRNLSSHSDAARRRIRETEGLLDSLCDIVKFMAINLDDYDINGRGIEGAICALRNLTYKIHREASNTQEWFKLGDSVKLWWFNSMKYRYEPIKAKYPTLDREEE